MKQIKISFALCSLLFLVALNSSCQQQEKPKIIAADSLNAIIKSGQGVLIDVRTPEEYAEGHIPGAINIDYKNEGFAAALDTLDKTKQYEVYCRSGKRSAASAELMNEKGFKKVYDLEGGILNWQEKGLETVK